MIKKFCERISTHTAGRSFVTIIEMTGHRDLKTFNTYYKVDNIAKVDSVNLAFGSKLPKLTLI